MRYILLLTVALTASCLLVASASVNLPPANPQKPFVWQKASPDSQGMSSEKLNALKNDLAKRRTKAFLVIRNDKIVYEWYASGHGANRRHYTASLVKAIVAGLLLMLGLQDGTINIDDPASKYIAAWRKDPQKSKITVRHLATHSSGISDAEHGRKGWEGAFWARRPDPFTIARDKAPMLFKPGKSFEYSNPGMAMLAYAITAGYKGKKGTDHRTLLKKRIMDPIGVPTRDWSMGYGRTYRVDGLDLVANWGGGSYTARAVARVGRLMLHNGNWQGKQLLNAKLVKQSVTYAGTPKPVRAKDKPDPASGLCWWLNYDGVWPKAPRDAFVGAGAGHQILMVVPSQKLIVVRMGGPLGQANWSRKYWGSAERYLFTPLMAAIAEKFPHPRPLSPSRGERSLTSGKSSNAPYPQSAVIRGIEWAPKSTIIRKARGSDNWPMTWADDDNQYTAYGDGRGFQPFTPKKLGMGFAKIIGNPTTFKGVNIRSPANETRGFGPNGKKASGMLMVDGVLYMLARNAGNSQLAWSTDYGRNWTWSKWKFTTSFGYPTFLNFGKNYAGARDDYVYIYSHDSNSAYQAADRMVLARVPRNHLKKREAYEFFQKLGGKRRPIWTKDVAKRGAVFTHSEKCYRTGITYNAGLKRYLWCQVLAKSRTNPDPRFRGGIGIFDAAQPWGPWTTVFFTETWDVGPGETASFPTKWMSRDGRTLHLVFSGDDCFSVRRARLSVKN